MRQPLQQRTVRQLDSISHELRNTLNRGLPELARAEARAKLCFANLEGIGDCYQYLNPSGKQTSFGN